MFTPRYQFPKYSNLILNDFKGHQWKALQTFTTILPQVNLMVELRDLRAPISSRNCIFEILHKKYKTPRLIVYTKGDKFLSNNSSSGNTMLTPLVNKLNELHAGKDEYIIVDGRNTKQNKHLLDIIKYKYYSEDDYPLGFRLLICGIPNVGKSTIINSLRKNYFTSTIRGERTMGGTSKFKKVAKTGDEAGVTRKTSEVIKIDDCKNGIYLFDTPGISLPKKVMTQEKFLSLSLCGSVKKNIVDPVIQADYLLYLVNLQRDRLKMFGAGSTTSIPLSNNIYEVLDKMNGNNEKQNAMNFIDSVINGSNVLFDVDSLAIDQRCYDEILNSEVAKLGGTDDFISTVLYGSSTITKSNKGSRAIGSKFKKAKMVNKIF
ncbi:related to Mitochondrial GTPase 1 [Saccharomycodes ludwigii]|uniref:Related to Mitochondrial GTPase 1 n=1 Tax=Saccharomycodes ludwigii TaxID=36035 RepID=A0A376B7Q1_9ASCO|nr:hypothetical protein SCDLUD_004077 [Saccharomycodes ludwigii]KAH3899786.1 hypothetical protein SCDLUD_004077 [Saccharomycodes ludwigii]SSD60672.1 related to Mitochondrial GTPase 1 [Saccharomycodes ludwigii]